MPSGGSEVACHCDFQKGSGSREASAPLHSDEVWYVARAWEWFEQNLYRQGDLLVIDPQSKRVWWPNGKN